MSTLGLHEVHDFWRKYDDPMIYKILCQMEAVETWPLDGDPDLEGKIDELAETLDKLKQLKLNDMMPLLTFSCHLKMSRILKLLQILDHLEPGTASKLLIQAEDSPEDEAQLFLRRNIVFERLRLLSRIFSKQRINTVLQALER
jgi:intracellular multiplication protein IcmW